MVDAREAAHEAASRMMSKGSKWRTKIFSKDDSPRQAEPKASKQQIDSDVSDFLKPSTDKAAAASAANSSRPRIDIARAQRWPGAKEILNSSAAKSPGPGGLKKGTRQRGLSVSFARAVPDVIGHGGDECEEPSVEVSKRKKASNASNASQASRTTTPPPPQKPQDDANLNTNMNRTPSQTQTRNSLTRTLTSHGEMSPPLGKKLEMGHINSYAQAPPPPPPQRVGPMGLGERPRGLSRAPTGFDSLQLDNLQIDPNARRPSHDSAHSQDSDNLSPVLARKISNVEPTIQEEEDNFRPKALSRTQTGFSTYEDGDDDDAVPAVPAVPRLPDMRSAGQEDESPLDTKAMLVDRYLQSEPARSDSFTTRAKQRMRAEEGKTLQESAQHIGSKRDSDSSMQSDPFQVGTPPQSYRASPLTGRTPPAASPSRLEAEDPFRSRVRRPSPARPAVPGTLPLDADGRPPSSGSSQYAASSAASHAHTSPTARSDPLSATTIGSVQRIPSLTNKTPSSTITQISNVPIPPQSEQRPAHVPPPQTAPQAFPPSLVHDHRMPPGSPSSQMPLRPRNDTNDSLQAPLRPRQDTNDSLQAPLGRSDTRSLGEAALRDFTERVTHMKGIFELTAQLAGNLYDKTPMQWLRVATWWFLRGRTGMETFIRSRPRNAESQPERLTQAHVDLAKVLWIATEIIPNHPALRQYSGQADLARQAGDGASAEAYDIQAALLHYLKLLVGSMKKHQSMPPTQALIQGQDQSIWAEYPRFAPDAASVLQAGFPKKEEGGRNGAAQSRFGLSQYIPLADTMSDFCYFRMFVKASMSTDDPNTDRVPMSAVISVLRPKDQYQVKLSVCSQNDMINIVLGPGVEGGPTWNDVNWKRQSSQISINLRHGFTLSIELSEGDWRSLYSIVDHTNRVQTDLRERKEERIACKLQLREATYKDPANPGAFPQERVPGCKLMVFERIERSSEGTGKRKLHRGYRMALATTPQNKQVSLINHEIGTKQAPMNFEYVTEADQAPAMWLHFREETPDKKLRTCSVQLVFQEGKDRNLLFGTLTSMNIAQSEATFAQVPLKSFHIESADQAEGFSQKGSRVLEKLQWQEAKVVNQDPDAAGLESAPTVMSESLRIVCRHSAGIIADRMNLGKSACG
jgi:hypothetical protein